MYERVICIQAYNEGRMSLMNQKQSTKKQKRNLYKQEKRPVRQAIKQPIITVKKMDMR